jgi:hypothetical protein
MMGEKTRDTAQDVMELLRQRERPLPEEDDGPRQLSTEEFVETLKPAHDEPAVLDALARPASRGVESPGRRAGRSAAV